MNARNRLPRVLTQAESDALLAVIHRPRDRAAVCVPLFAGLRATETVTLKLEHINLEECLLRFVGKGSKEAEISINEQLKDELKKALQDRPATEHDYLLWDLTTPTKKGISRFGLYKMIVQYGQKAGIKHKVTPHLLRHTFLTNYYRDCGDLGRVQKAARHENPETTTLYTHLSHQDQKKDLDRLDTRSRWAKWRAKLRPDMPELLRSKHKGFYIGQTIGREEEIAALRKAFGHGRNTVLIGDVGTGKKHLLKGLYEEKKKQGEWIYQLDEFKPARTAVVNLCTQLQADGLIDELPKSQSAGPFTDAIRAVAKREQITLVIYALDDIQKSEIREFKKLAEQCIIFAATLPNQRAKLRTIFFGNYQEIEIDNFDRSIATQFAEKAMADMEIADKDGYIDHIFQETEGNARGLLECIEATRESGNIEPEHTGQRDKRSAEPFFYFILATAMGMRYSATSFSLPEWKIFLCIIGLFVAAILTLGRVLKA